jgi:hypothetical protein
MAADQIVLGFTVASGFDWIATPDEMNSASCSNHDAADLRWETPDLSRLDEYFRGLARPGNDSGNQPFSSVDPASGAHRGPRTAAISAIGGSLGRPANTPQQQEQSG